MSTGYLCDRCGAPLKVTPESVVVVCEYCGKPHLVAGLVDLNKIFVLPTYPREYIVKAFWTAIERDFDLQSIKSEISVRSIDGVYIPVWVGKIYLKGYVSYYYYVTEYKKRDKRVETRRRRVYRTVTIDETYTVPVVARRQYFRLGAEEAAKEVVSSNSAEYAKKLLDLDLEKWNKMKLEVLNTELDEKMVSLEMKDSALDHLRSYYRSKGTIDCFNVAASEPQDLKLYLVPVWRICYEYRESLYSAFFTGWNLRLLVKTEPVTALRRIAYALGALASIVASPIFAIIASSTRPELLILSLLALTGAYHFSSSFLKSVRIEERT